jgi:hypothetical protein
MLVRLIGKANGVGLSRDLNLLDASLRSAGCEVVQQPCDRRERRRRRSLLSRLTSRLQLLRPQSSRIRFDVNVMLEHVWPQFLHEARYNVLVPNPEWFDRRDAALVAWMDCIWAKTALTGKIFNARGCRTLYIGFDSEDRFDANVARHPRFLHIGGRSELKGTTRLLTLWRQHPDWPQLTVVQDAAAVKTTTGQCAANIVIESGYLDDAALRALQNSNRFHLCLSEAEGWGHYIAEALSIGAMTITCDAAPMNELVSSQRGVLVAASQGPDHNLIRLALFETEALESAVSALTSMMPVRLEAVGREARDWFLANKREFPARVQHAVADIEDELRRRRP